MVTVVRTAMMGQLEVQEPKSPPLDPSRDQGRVEVDLDMVGDMVVSHLHSLLAGFVLIGFTLDVFFLFLPGQTENERVRQMEGKIITLTKNLHDLQSTLNTMKEQFNKRGFSGGGAGGADSSSGVRNPADAAQPEIKETIHSIQTKLDQLDNRTQVRHWLPPVILCCPDLSPLKLQPKLRPSYQANSDTMCSSRQLINNRQLLMDYYLSLLSLLLLLIELLMFLLETSLSMFGQMTMTKGIRHTGDAGDMSLALFVMNSLSTPLKC